MKHDIVGTDDWGGAAPSQPRKDLPAPTHWRLEAVAAVERPHDLVADDPAIRLAFVLDRADVGSDIWVLEPGSSPDRITVDRPPAAYWEDTAPAWSHDGTTIAYTGDGGVRAVAADGGPSRAVVDGGAPVWLPDGRLVVTVEWPRAPSSDIHPRSTEVSRLAIVEPADPWPHAITPGDGDAAQAAPSHDGTRVAYTWFSPDDRNQSDIRVIDLPTGAISTVASVPHMHAHSPVWSPDDSVLVYVSEEPGWHQIHLVSPDGGDSRRLTEGDGDFGSLRWSADGRHIAALCARHGRTSLVVLSVDNGTVETWAEGGDWQSPVWLADGAIAAIFEDHRTPARIEKVTAATRTILFDPAPRPIVAAPHISPEEVWYESSDGLSIHGFRFRPPGASAESPAPAVVYPHGGPTSAYTDAWDGHAQYFLDKGYAWFAINFRGSTSYGRTFERANHGVWGTADTEDCLAAADHLAGLDWVDGARIAIFGASYGSYMALCSLANDPQHRFACGVAKYGDCDILTSWAQGDRVGIEDLERQMGHPADARAAYRAGSPVHRVNDIERPLFVAHGEQDARVHPKQSEELVAALARHAKTYEYVTYPTEGHGLLRLGPQLHFYRRLERFLDWYTI